VRAKSAWTALRRSCGARRLHLPLQIHAASAIPESSSASARSRGSALIDEEPAFPSPPEQGIVQERQIAAAMARPGNVPWEVRNFPCCIAALRHYLVGKLAASAHPHAAISLAVSTGIARMEFSYFLHEASLALIGPARAATEAARLFFENPANPASWTPFGRSVSAACDVFERSTRRYEKPEFGLSCTTIGRESVKVSEEIVWQRPFCRLIHFARDLPPRAPKQPKLLIVAPMSGHYATLLRGTVEAFLARYEVYITDWSDARMVPLTAGSFGFDDYVDYVIAMLRELGPRTHVIAVCQPSVPVSVAVAVLEAAKDPVSPVSMILMGGPIDTRESPTAVNVLAQERGTAWFRRNCITRVPFPYPGMMREVYPGFLQLSGFMAMNLDRHLTAHWDYYKNLVQDNGDSAEKHREFYDEYLAVMDLTAEFYLETVDRVFVKRLLPRGEMRYRGKKVDLADIRRTGLMTIEGENDDISGVGQTHAAQHLCVNIPVAKRVHYLQKRVGHYGVFNGSRFRDEIVPRIDDFILAMDKAQMTEKTNVP
jgi:poly(3-hydroxybutyrate) depolymerase